MEGVYNQNKAYQILNKFKQKLRERVKKRKALAEEGSPTSQIKQLSPASPGRESPRKFKRSTTIVQKPTAPRKMISDVDSDVKKRFWLYPNSLARMIIEVTHFFLIVYSAFTIPLIVTFDLELGIGFYYMEIVCLAEGIVYSLLQLRVAEYEQGIVTLNFK